MQSNRNSHTHRWGAGVAQSLWSFPINVDLPPTPGCLPWMNEHLYLYENLCADIAGCPSVNYLNLEMTNMFSGRDAQTAVHVSTRHYSAA